MIRIMMFLDALGNQTRDTPFLQQCNTNIYVGYAQFFIFDLNDVLVFSCCQFGDLLVRARIYLGNNQSPDIVQESCCKKSFMVDDVSILHRQLPGNDGCFDTVLPKIA